MISTGPKPVRLAALLYLLTAALAMPLAAAERDAFIVQRSEFTLHQRLLHLDLVVDAEIPDYIALAIDKGFAVPFMFEVEIRAHKDYWFDEKVVSLKQQYLMHYLPMLGSFSLLDVNSGERLYFDSRKAALRHIEVVYNYPMLDIDNLAIGKSYYARVRFGIDTDELPLPLKSSSLWDNDWDLKSDWYKWEIDKPES